MITIIMPTTEIGIRELKTHLSALLRRVKRGESLTVTDRGTPVARIVPARVSSREAMAALQEAGLVDWSGEKFSPQQPRAAVQNRGSVVESLPNLTPAEQALFHSLARTRLRLEQERIPHAYVLDRLSGVR